MTAPLEVTNILASTYAVFVLAHRMFRPNSDYPRRLCESRLAQRRAQRGTAAW